MDRGGVIYDRAGHILVRNRPSFAISIVPADLPRDEAQELAVVHRLAELLGSPAKASSTRATLPSINDALPRFKLLLSEEEILRHIEDARARAARIVPSR